MKLKNFVKLFSFVSFLMLSCCFVPKIFAADYKGIDYTLEGSTLTINKDIEDEKIRIEFAKTLREKDVYIDMIQTPIFKYTLSKIPIESLPGGKCGRHCLSEKEYVQKYSHLPVSVTWEFINKHVKPPEKPDERDKMVEALKIKSIVPFIIFDAVRDGGGSVTIHRRDGDPELYVTKSGGIGVRKQETSTTYSCSSRLNKRLILKFYIDPTIPKFFKRLSEIVSSKELCSFGRGFQCSILNMAILSDSSSSSSSSSSTD